MARENGTAFPATTFLWIHHNTKDGTKFRGTDTLRNAVHETWELKDLSDEERAQYGDHALILEIDKSRGMRGGDRFLVREDIEEALSIEDLTPTVTRENGGQGDEQPRTIVLGILKDAEGAMTAKELRYALNARLSGRRGPGTCVSEKTVKRWVQRWVVAGLVEESTVRQEGGKKGHPWKAFSLKTPIYQAQDVRKCPEFFEGPSTARDLNYGHELSVNAEEDKVSVYAEDETVQRDTVSSETHETVENLGKNPTEEAPAFTDNTDTEEGLSVNATAETSASTAVSENEPVFTDTLSVIYGDPVSPQSYADWDDEGWD